MTKTGAVKAMVLLTAAYPQDIPEPTLQLYCESLSDLPDEVILEACRRLVLNSRFLPRISEIREATMRLAAPNLMPPEPWEAWDEIMTTIHNGVNGVLQWSHPVIGKVVKGLGGYNAICRATDTDRLRTQFHTLYRQAHEQTVKSTLSTTEGLAAIHEAHTVKAISETDQKSILEKTSTQ
jgi:hypothetical protein